MNGPKLLRTVAYLSAAYDALLALPLVLLPTVTARLFGLADPAPVVNAQINGVFALSLAVGYLWAARDPMRREGYFWAAGVLAKGLGATVFVVDHLTRHSPGSLLLFAVTDGSLALATLAVLLLVRTPPREPASTA
jgi:hypothetical protein